MAKPAKGKSVLYIEVPRELKEAMERLAAEDLRSLTSEVVFALREFVARRDKAAAEEKGGAQ
jgi:hypothetical protein